MYEQVKLSVHAAKERGGIEYSSTHSYARRNIEVSVKSHTLAYFLLGREQHIPIEQDAGWATKPVWEVWRTEKSLSPVGIRTPDCPVRSQVTIGHVPPPLSSHDSHLKCHLLSKRPA